MMGVSSDLPRRDISEQERERDLIFNEIDHVLTLFKNHHVIGQN
jgi:hypothetical protein